MNDDYPQRLPGYELLDVISPGGTDILYRARQHSLDRVVAVRTKRGPAGDKKLAARLLFESGLIARIQHPHVVKVFDRLEFEGRLYVVHEYADGGTLAQRIAGQEQLPGPAASLVERLARALDHIHQRGILHCNLHPRTVLLTASPSDATSFRPLRPTCDDVYGSPLVSGFGSAIDRQSPTEGVICGMIQYLAPEQIQCRTGDIGPATDVYGLGGILYEMLTGRPPIQGRSMSERMKNVVEQIPDPIHLHNPRVSDKLAAICEKCLLKDPAQRYAGAPELAFDLRNHIEGE